MKLLDFCLLLLLGTLFASAFLFIRIAVPVLGPFFLMDARVILAALVLLGWAQFKGEKVRFTGKKRHWLALGAFNAAIPFSLLAWAELHISSSLAAILIATMPLFTSVISAIWLNEAISLKKACGLALGLLGVAILSGLSPVELSLTHGLTIAATLGTSFSYAFGGVYIKKYFQGVPRVTLTIGNFTSAGLLLLPFAFMNPPSAMPDLTTVAVVLGLVILASVFPYVIMFRLIETNGTTTAASVAFLIPAFGALMGTVFLGETINLAMLLGMGVIFSSIVLVNNINLGFNPLRARWHKTALNQK